MHLDVRDVGHPVAGVIVDEIDGYAGYHELTPERSPDIPDVNFQRIPALNEDPQCPVNLVLRPQISRQAKSRKEAK
jgi:hypothetical protein